MKLYKPSMKLVVAAYIEGLSESKANKQALADEFHRWLASVKADAWDEGYYFKFERAEDNQLLTNPYRGEQA